MITVLLVVLLFLAIFGLPFWPYAAAWDLGYWPSGFLFLLFIVLLIVALSNASARTRGPLV